MLQGKNILKKPPKNLVATRKHTMKNEKWKIRPFFFPTPNHVVVREHQKKKKKRLEKRHLLIFCNKKTHKKKTPMLE
jgi:hypothetical protein